MKHRTRLFCLLGLLATYPLHAEQAELDASEPAASIALPELLRLENGNRVTSPQAWIEIRRAEIIELFESHMYGAAPSDTSRVRFGPAEVDQQALGGTAVRKQVKIYFDGTERGPAGDLLIYLPGTAQEPPPVFLGLNFKGNHAVADEAAIWLPTVWVNGKPLDQAEVEQGRGSGSSRWPIREALARGYAVATMYYGDIDPDFDDGFQNGVHPLFYTAGQTETGNDQWGSIAAWAWGLSRALDYLETDGDLDAKRVAVLGHSRLGKTALWAGARDPRFAMVISNNSGCGGAALSRRRVGETVRRINTSFPHWFCKNFHQYNENEDALPVDQHMLAALVAPRPLYVASAEEDSWADPEGEFLSLRYASPAYELLGRKAISDAEMPAVNQPLMRDVAYHLRTGKHNITAYDWRQFMDFADRHFK